MEQGPYVRRSNAVAPARGREQMVRVAVLHAHAFRLPGRTRGVDHIAQVRGRSVSRRRRVFALAGRRRIPHPDQNPAEIPEAISRLLAADQRAGADIVQHPCEAFRRMVEIQRHVKGARLQHGQNCDDAVHAAPKRQRDRRVAAHPGRVQPPGQPVGAAIQFRVSERLAVALQRNGVRPRARLRLKTAMQALALRIVRATGRRVPARGQRAASFVAQQRHPRDAQRRAAAFKLAQHPRQHLHDPLRRRRRDPLAVEMQTQAQTLAGNRHHGQRVIGLLDHLDIAHAQLLAIAFRIRPRRVVLKHHQALEQGRAGSDSAPARNRVQRGIRIGFGVDVLAMQPPQPVAQRQFKVDGRARRQRVDKEPHHLLDAAQRRRPAGHGGPEHHVVAAARARQQQSPGGLDHRALRELALSRQTLQPLARSRVELAFYQTVAGRAVRTRVVGERQGRGRAHIAQPRSPESLGLGAVLFVQPAQEGAVRLGRRHSRNGAAPVSVVKGERLPQHNLHRPTIQQQMVIAPHELVALLSGAE